MKVALIIDTWFPFIGGGQINAWEISRRIAMNGVKVDIITRNNGRDSLPKSKNLTIIKLGPYKKPQDSISKILFIFQSAKFVIKGNYDVVHAHAFLPGFSLKIISFFRKTPTVYTVHGTGIYSKLNNFYINYLEKLLLTRLKYSAQITVSQDFLKLKNINRNIVYIPNGVDVEKFDEIKTNKGIFPSLLFVGRLHPQKNLLSLIKALPELIENWHDLKLQIIGTGQQKKELMSLAKKLKVSNKIIFRGELKGKELIKAYKSSDLFILPSIYEGQPLVLLESWASKVPVVASKTGDCKYMIKDGVNGYLINGEPSRARIFKSTQTALANQNLPSLGENGYKMLKNKYSWELATKKTLSVYKKINKDG